MTENFEFDGELASDFGLLVCNIGSANGEEIVSVGAELNFNQTSTRHGSYYYNTDITYDAPFEITFKVCKYDCNKGIQKLTFEEARKITRWLNRKEPCILKIVDDSNEDANRYMYEGSFNLDAIYYYGEHVGYELHFISNRPYAIGRSIVKYIHADTENYEYKFYDSSDEVGYIYPKKITIECKADGQLDIINYSADNPDGRITRIKKCSIGEIITFDDKLTIATSLPSHETTIQNDFNFCFFRIANSYKDKLNRLSISIPCEIKIEYNPIVKGVGL